MSMYNSRGWLAQIPPVTRNLIIINALIWIAAALIPGFGNMLYEKLGLHYVAARNFNPVQIVTYMFIHDRNSIFHLLFNMFTLWMFGRVLEQVWGSRRFLIFYFICGVGAALVQEGIWALTIPGEYLQGIAATNHLSVSEMQQIVEQYNRMGNTQFAEGLANFAAMHLTVGASGTIFGLLLGFAMVFPDMPLYLFFIPVPIKAKWMVLGYGVIEFFLGISTTDSTVAHFAHLGGMLFGLILLLYWRKKGTLRGGNFY